MSKKTALAVPQLTDIQLAHLVHGAVRNIVDLKFSGSNGGIKFQLILECLSPDACIPPDLKPESEQEEQEIAEAHGVFELFDFFKTISCVESEEGQWFRAFVTVDITSKNVFEFVRVLSKLDDYWEKIEREMQEDATLETRMKGKNVVKGNETVN